MISDLTRHQIYIQRFGNGIYKGVAPLLAAIRDKLTGRIMNATPAQLRKIEILLSDIEAGLVPVSEKLFSGLYDFAKYENTWALKLLDSATLPSVTIGAAFELERIKALVDNSKIQFADSADGMTVSELFTTFSDRFKKDVKQEIELGIASGETSDQIARRIKSLTDNRTAEQAKAVVITAANHAGSVTRAETFGEYGHLFKGEEYVAVLDSRTTIICASNDGKLFPMGKGPKPPLHYRCRSVRVPVLKDQYALGGDTTRSSASGQVSAKLTYSDWLKGQSAQVQNEVLGVERAKLFREGKITLDRFVDNTGKTYALEDLKTVDAGGYFVRAESLKEVTSRLYALGIKQVDVKGLSMPKANGLLRAFEFENSKRPLNINTLDGGTRHKVKAMYADSTKTIAFNKKYLGSADQVESTKTYEDIIKSNEDTIAEYTEKYLGNDRYNQTQVKKAIRALRNNVSDLQYRIARGEEAVPFSMSSTFGISEEESTYRTMTHELGHHRHYQLFNASSARFKFDPSQSVSEYGKTNSKEYFAELYTEYRVNGSARIPDDILKLFKEVDYE